MVDSSSLLKDWLWKDIYKIMILVLIVLSMYSGTVYFGLDKTLPQLIVAVLTAVIADGAIKYFKTKKFVFSKSATISGLFVGNILAVGEAFHVVIIAALLAILSKHIIKIKGKHIFNPASFGLVSVIYIFGAAHAWWASREFLAVLILGLYVVYRFERFHLVLAYLVSYALMFSVFSLFAGQNPSGILGQLLDPTLLFFTFLMLIEPKTSPFTTKGRIVFGIVAAFFTFALPFVYTFNLIPFNLLLANLTTPIINKYVR